MNYILGGGLIGLLARDILGPEWKIIPYGRSIFYSFYPPVVDNYIIRNSDIDDYMSRHAILPVYVKNAYSMSGSLLYQHNLCLRNWLYKVYGLQVPPHADGYYRSTNEYFVYGDCVEINKKLQTTYLSEIMGAKENIGTQVTDIRDGVITTDKDIKLPYDKILSTIPLSQLLKTVGVTYNLPSRDLWCYHIETDKLDLEKNTHVRIVDEAIEFFKATQVSKTTYIFYSTKQIIQPGRLFMSLIPGEFKLVAEVQIKEAIPCGEIPFIKELNDNNINCLGSLASWDDCLDVGSCIMRLVKRNAIKG